jgi:hypothetical protein
MMGTNYYIYVDTDDTSPDGVEVEKLHIGKSSAGWVFSLRVYADRGILSLYDWLPVLLNSQNVIRDEYGRNITAHDMLRTITMRERTEPVNWSELQFEINQAEPGPCNLVRHREMSGYGRKVTHGEGVWDYCDYEFD